MTEPTPFVVPPPATSPSARIVALGNGLAISVPESWALSGPRWVNRATQRLLLTGNGDLDALPGLPGNGDVDAVRLPSGRVTVEIESFCRMSCRGPEDETALPFDWSAAAPVFASLEPDVSAAGRHEIGVAIRWLDQPIYMIARWADDAPAADIAAIPLIARSLRADPPTSAVYGGWADAGALANLAVGTVRRVPLPEGAIPQRRIQDATAFFLVRGAQTVLALSSHPLRDERCEVSFDEPSDRFVCRIDGRTYEWTRSGTYVGTSPQSDLSQHRVIVRAGEVWVNYDRDSLIGPAAEVTDR